MRQINEEAVKIMNKAIEELYQLQDLSGQELVGLLQEYIWNELWQMNEDDKFKVKIK